MILAWLLAACGPDCEAHLSFPDADGDGFGDAAGAVRACDAPAGSVEDGGDCDDGDAAVFPGAPEVWYDGVDGDCAGGDDFDADGDGRVPPHDCDDADPAVHPGAAEAWYDGVDQDCDGDDLDRDGDGTEWPDDCDDADADVFPGAPETWYDGLDGACDGGSDFDQDADGFDLGDDCDDTDAAVNPQAEEVCGNGVDDDCDGFGCGLQGTWSLGSAAGTWVGAAGGYLGQRLAGGEDVDGDGAIDVVATEPGTGTVWVMSAAASGVADATGTALGGFTADVSGFAPMDVAVGPGVLLVGDYGADTVTRITGGAAEAWSGDGAGYRLAAAGDLDDDGLPDQLVAWPRDPRDAADGDCVAVLLGSASAGPLEEAGPSWCASEPGAYASRPGAGDLDGDGLIDGLVGAPGVDTAAGEDAGAVYVLLSPGAADVDLDDADARIDGDHAQDAAGSPVTAGDLDGDGADDVVLLAAGEDVRSDDDGAAYAFLSVRSATLAEADVVLTGVPVYDEVHQVEVVGDLDGDGREDLAAALTEDWGFVYAFPGLQPGAWTYDDAALRWVGEVDDDVAGTDLAALGDADGDGFGDVAVSAPGAGRVYLWRGGAAW